MDVSEWYPAPRFLPFVHVDGEGGPPQSVGQFLRKDEVSRTPQSLSWLTSYSYGHPMDVAGFDLNLLKTFDALYAERHVTRAGQRIGLSQPAMSGALTRLREVFGDELFAVADGDATDTARR